MKTTILTQNNTYKTTFLLLSTLMPHASHTMEVTANCYNIFSLFTTSLINLYCKQPIRYFAPSDKIQQIKDKKNNFINALSKGVTYAAGSSYYKHNILTVFKGLQINPYTTENIAKKVVHYAYFQEYHPDILDLNLTIISSNKELLTQCLAMKIDGYSGFGAAVIAPNVSIENKKQFIKNLCNIGFIPTEKDKELLYLEWYKQNKANNACYYELTRGKTDTNSILFFLPKEIVLYIGELLIATKKYHTTSPFYGQ